MKTISFDLDSWHEDRRDDITIAFDPKTLKMKIKQNQSANVQSQVGSYSLEGNLLRLNFGADTAAERSMMVSRW